MTDADVAVIGLGAIGALTMWQLAQAGVDAIGFEQFNVGHDRGGVGGDSRLFRSAYFEGVQYESLLAQARDAWVELNHQSGRQVFSPTGGLTIGPADHPGIADLVERVGSLGPGVAAFDSAQAQQRWPMHQFQTRDQVIHDESAGLLRADLAVVSAVTLAQRMGATVRPACRVAGVSSTNDTVVIETDDRTWTVKRAIVAAGSWSPSLLPGPLKGKFVPRRHLLSWFLSDRTNVPPATFPPFVRTVDGRFLYGTPPLDGETIKLGGVTPDLIPDADGFDRRHTAEESREMTGIVRRYFRGINPEAVRSDAYTDLLSPDTHGVVGEMPGAPGVLIATGFSGRGFKLAPVVAAHLVGLVTGSEDARFDFMASSRLQHT